MSTLGSRRLPQLVSLLGLILCIGGAVMTAHGDATVLYVSPHGNDLWSGTTTPCTSVDGPFATLERARDAIRAMKQGPGLPDGGVIVELEPGAYELDNTFELTAEDSGTEAAPITYRARPGAEVRVVGGKVLGGFKPVTDPEVLARLEPDARGKVYQTDLKAHGITDYGWPSAGGLELFFNDEPMRISRWPNEGFVNIVDVVGGEPIDVRGTKGDKIGKFTYDYDRPERWTQEKELWLHGYWFWDWSDERHRVASIDTENKTITLKPPYHRYGFRKGQWYYALNALCEIDQPEEWYLDRETGILYFYPPSSLDEGTAAVSVAQTLVSLSGVSHVTLQGLTLEAGRRTAVEISGGTGCRVLGCTIRNMGRWAVTISEGSENGVEACDIYGTGEGGISLSGGDRKTLTPAGHYAQNNHIHHYSRLNRISQPGVRLSGVGHRASHNLIHNAPHQAMSFSGNDHVIEFNEIHSVCYESNDAGAIYAGRDWTMRGTVIRYNYFHDISGLGGRGCVGVYLDDAFSGTTTYGNLFYKVTRAAMTGGGRDNIVENNIFVDCVPAVHIDERGVGWAKTYIVEGGSWNMYEKLAAVNYDQPPYSERFPELVRILDEAPAEPRGNVVTRNIIIGGEPFSVRCDRAFNLIEDNLIDEDPHFVDRNYLDFRLKDDSPAFDLGFQPLPLDEIGLYESPLRASWPVTHEVRDTIIEARKPEPERKRTGPLAVLKAPRIAEAPAIDGKIAPGEWPDAAKVLLERGIYDEKATPTSTAWVAWDAGHLLVAIDNTVAANPALQTGDEWGPNDAVEIAVRGPEGGKDAPILVLRGFVSGAFESSREAGATPEAVKRAAQGVEYAATKVGADQWTCEWRIPFASLGIDPAKHTKLGFNLSVRKTATDLWLMWQGSFGRTWQVDNTGFVELAQ